MSPWFIVLVLTASFSLYVLSDSYGWLIRNENRRLGNLFINLGGGFLIGGLVIVMLAGFYVNYTLQLAGHALPE